MPEPEETVEYGIRWAEPIPGFLDVTGPYDEEGARDGLRRSAFDGTVVRRTVKTYPWEPC